MNMRAGTTDADRVADFAAIFAAHPPGRLIANLRARVEPFQLGGLNLPLTLNDRDEAGNNYLCRPTAAYVDYALDETRHFAAAPVWRGALRAVIRSAAPLVRASGLDHQVQVNNWLLSTNPAPALTRNDAAELRDALIARFPDRAIVMRSVNECADAATMAALRAKGFALLAARQVYLWRSDGTGRRPGRDVRRDLRLLAGTPLELVTGGGFAGADFDRAADLYRMLYLEKYTALNPAYTSLFLREMQRAGILRLLGLRDPDSGDLVAMTGLFESGGTLTQPIVGYDTARPQAEGLYRMTMALSRQEAEARGLLFNMSAGAAGFKRARGGVPAIEYSAVHVRHLGHGPRAAVAAMRQLLDGIGVPVMRRFGL